MDVEANLLRHLYERLNARDIDGVLTALADDVAWANGMEGGYVYGRDAVRAYWIRQWAIVSPRVESVSFRMAADRTVVVEVRQSVRDLEGRPLHEQAHGLKETTVSHAFEFRDGMIVRFDIQNAVVSAGCLPDHPIARQPPHTYPIHGH